jgi:hypothetical protein
MIALRLLGEKPLGGRGACSTAIIFSYDCGLWAPEESVCDL